MRRRLSVAMAFTGDADLILLDEPTTGLDPVNRRHVWDMIEKCKPNAAIVLSTHSIEEAEVIADRIGIMFKGQVGRFFFFFLCVCVSQVTKRLR